MRRKRAIMNRRNTSCFLNLSLSIQYLIHAIGTQFSYRYLHKFTYTACMCFKSPWGLPNFNVRTFYNFDFSQRRHGWRSKEKLLRIRLSKSDLCKRRRIKQDMQCAYRHTPLIFMSSSRAKLQWRRQRALFRSLVIFCPGLGCDPPGASHPASGQADQTPEHTSGLGLRIHAP